MFKIIRRTFKNRPVAGSFFAIFMALAIIIPVAAAFLNGPNLSAPNGRGEFVTTPDIECSSGGPGYFDGWGADDFMCNYDEWNSCNPGIPSKPDSCWTDNAGGESGCCGGYYRGGTGETTWTEPGTTSWTSWPSKVATVSGTTTCTNNGTNGWCIGTGKLKLSGNDPLPGFKIDMFGGFKNGTEQFTVTATGGSATVTGTPGITDYEFWAISSFGDDSNKGSATLKIDNDNPTVTKTITGVKQPSTLYTSNVILSASGSDATSGFKNAQISINGGNTWGGANRTLNTDGTFDVKFRAYDKAGRSATTGITTIKVDLNKPIFAPSVTGTAGTNGWYTDASVTVSANASDGSGSGIFGVEMKKGAGTFSANTSMTAGEGTHIFGFRALDVAGNLATQTGFTVNVDATTPTLTVTEDGTAGLAGWYTSASVTVKASSSDATSGILSLQTKQGTGTYSNADEQTVTGDGTHTVDATTTDMAGHTTSESRTIKIDTTAPTVSPTASGTLGDNGWYTTDATVDANASDATSGIATTQMDIDSGGWSTTDSLTLTEGTYTVSAKTTDNAGHDSATIDLAVKVDTTDPALTVNETGTAGRNGWYISNTVTAKATSTDATSKVATLMMQVDGDGFISTNSKTVSGDGMHTVDTKSTDNAGNETTKANAIYIDTVAPSLSLTSHSVGSSTEIEENVTISGAASDATSGLDSVKAVTVTIKGKTFIQSVDGSGNWSFVWDSTLVKNGSVTVEVVAKDQAGHETTRTFTLVVENERPYIELPATCTPVNEAMTLVIGASDANLLDGSSLTLQGDTYQLGATPPGSWIWVDYATDPATYPVTVKAWDTVNNTTTQSSCFILPPPVLTLTSHTPDSNTVVTNQIEITGTATDSIIGIDTVSIMVGDQRYTESGDGAWSITWDSASVRNGAVNVLVVATNKAGHTTERLNFALTVNNIPPQINLPDVCIEAGYPMAMEILPGTNSVTGAELTIESLTEDFDKTELPNSWTWTEAPTTPGNYTLRVKAWDGTGNTTIREACFVVHPEPTPEPVTTNTDSGSFGSASSGSGGSSGSDGSGGSSSSGESGGSSDTGKKNPPVKSLAELAADPNAPIKTITSTFTPKQPKAVPVADDGVLWGAAAVAAAAAMTAYNLDQRRKKEAAEAAARRKRYLAAKAEREAGDDGNQTDEEIMAQIIAQGGDPNMSIELAKAIITNATAASKKKAEEKWQAERDAKEAAEKQKAVAANLAAFNTAGGKGIMTDDAWEETKSELTDEEIAALKPSGKMAKLAEQGVYPKSLKDTNAKIKPTPTPHPTQTPTETATPFPTVTPTLSMPTSTNTPVPDFVLGHNQFVNPADYVDGLTINTEHNGLCSQFAMIASLDYSISEGLKVFSEMIITSDFYDGTLSGKSILNDGKDDWRVWSERTKKGQLYDLNALQQKVNESELVYAIVNAHGREGTIERAYDDVNSNVDVAHWVTVYDIIETDAGAFVKVFNPITDKIELVEWEKFQQAWATTENMSGNLMVVADE